MARYKCIKESELNEIQKSVTQNRDYLDQQKSELKEMKSDVKQILEYVNQQKGRTDLMKWALGSGWVVTIITLIWTVMVK